MSPEKDYLLEAVFSEYQKRVEAHFQATDSRIEGTEKLRERENELLEQQVLVAKAGIEIRLEGMNELRAQINKERGMYLEQSVFNVKHESVLGRLSQLDVKVANWEGRFWMLGAGITALVVAIQMVMNWVK